jgi:hypothetical protein
MEYRLDEPSMEPTLDFNKHEENLSSIINSCLIYIAHSK